MRALLLAAFIAAFSVSASAQVVSYSPSQGQVGLTGSAGTNGSTGAAGATGSSGSAATLAVGSVSTLSAGASATVANVGTSSAAVLNFGIPQGIAGPTSVGSPTTRTLSLATAYQATTTTKPSVVSVNLTSSASLSLSGGTTNSATVVIGATNGVAGGTGTAICSYSNANTGALTLGLALQQVYATTCTFALPTGWYFAIRQTAGTVSITSAFDQSVG